MSAFRLPVKMCTLLIFLFLIIFEEGEESLIDKIEELLEHCVMECDITRPSRLASKNC